TRMRGDLEETGLENGCPASRRRRPDDVPQHVAGRTGKPIVRRRCSCSRARSASGRIARISPRPIITDAGGSLTVCDKTITDVAVDDAHPALEAFCGPDHGNDRFQCCRQLMAATLNGAAGGAMFADLAKCDAICGNPASSDADVTACEGEADTFNGSGDNVKLPFPEGNADPDPCKAAAATACLIIDPTACAVQ